MGLAANLPAPFWRPAGLSRVARDPLAFSLTHFLCPRLPAHPAKRYSGSILAVIGDRVLDLAGRDPHDVDRVADHVAGAALAFGASGHTSTLRFYLALLSAKHILVLPLPPRGAAWIQQPPVLLRL